MQTEIDFYRILYKIAKLWPATYAADDTELKYRRINTFAVIDTEDEMLADTLMKDGRYKPGHDGHGLFFSRWWQDHQYMDSQLRKEMPALLVWKEEEKMHAPFSGSSYDSVLFRFCLQDRHTAKYQPGAFDLSKGQQRTTEQTQADLATIRRQLIAELRQWVYAEIAMDAFTAPVLQWIQQNHLTTIGAHSYKIKQRLASLLDAQEMDVSTYTNVTPDGLVCHFFSVSLALSSCASITIDYSKDVDTDEKADHPTSASA